MCAADEVALVDTMYGTNLCTHATACAFRVINCCKVIDNSDCTVWASLFAFTAADTAIGASLTCYSTLVVAGAFNNNSRGVVD